jgi:hypothetical protein
MTTKIKIAAFIVAITIIILILLGVGIVQIEHIKELITIGGLVVGPATVWIFKDDEVKAERKEKNAEIQKRKIAETQLNTLKMRGGKMDR